MVRADKVEWVNLVGRSRLGVLGEGRSKQQCAVAENTLKQKLCRAQLEAELPVRDGRNIRMSKGMVADLVPLGKLSLQQTWMLFAVQPNDEERRGSIRRFQRIQDRRGVGRIGTIVERKGDLFI